MNNIHLPSQDSMTGRALKTSFQAFIGFLMGLVVVIWSVPGVQAAVFMYLQENLFQLALSVGISSGIISFLFNLLTRNNQLMKY